METPDRFKALSQDDVATLLEINRTGSTAGHTFTGMVRINRLADAGLLEGFTDHVYTVGQLPRKVLKHRMPAAIRAEWDAWRQAAYDDATITERACRHCRMVVTSLNSEGLCDGCQEREDDRVNNVGY